MRAENREIGPLDLVSVGHITCDLKESGGSLPGGAAFFSGQAAKALGLNVGVLTRLGHGFPHRKHLANFQLQLQESQDSTVFENHYQKGHRTQILRSLAEPINAKTKLPPSWQQALAVYLCPVMGEVSLSMTQLFPKAMVALGAQGWMRKMDPGGHVEPLCWRPQDSDLKKVTLVVLSDEDAAQDHGVLDYLAERIPLVAFTQGKKGGVLYINGQPHPFPAFPTKEMDPTGAGDVFGAVMLLELSKGVAPLEAAHWAACVSSLTVEGPGVGGILNRREIQRRMKRLWG